MLDRIHAYLDSHPMGEIVRGAMAIMLMAVAVGLAVTG